MNPNSGEQLETDLIARIAQGDRSALADLYDRQAGLLYALILKILHDPAEAEDVLQDSFLQIWDKAASFDPSLGKPLSWTVTVTRNKALDRLRALQRQQQARDRVLATADPEYPPPPQPQLSGDSNLLVRAAMQKLPMEQRQAIELAFFAGLTQNEIAAHLNLPLGTIKARIRRGMIKMRDSLKPYL